MTLPSPLVIIAAAAWSAACLTAIARLLLRRRRDSRPEDGLLIGASALLAAAPCTWLVLSAVAADPSPAGPLIQLGFAAVLFVAAGRLRRRSNEPAGDTTYREKSALVVLFALPLVAANYLYSTWGAPADVAVGALVEALILLVVLMVVAHIVLALLHAPMADLDAPADERDSRVDLKSQRNAYRALLAAFWCMPVVLLAPLSLVAALQVWLALLVLAELVYYGSVVAYYRLGA